jgi:hypothetical protein
MTKGIADMPNSFNEAAAVEIGKSNVLKQLTPKAAAAKLHADRLAAGVAENLVNAGKLYLGQRQLTILRSAEPEDDCFSETEPMSVVTWVGTGKEQTIRDDLITNCPTGF